MPWDSGRPDAPPRATLPAPGECHVWPVRVIDRPEWVGFLDLAERQRVDKFRAVSARETFIVSRAAQRLIMSRYLDCAPDALVIRRDCGHCGDPGHGRPTVGSGTPDYSVSHSGDWLVLAVIGGGRIGLDVEHVRPRANIATLARRVLTPVERAEFEALRDGGQSEWFYRSWTRKEAAAKVTGQGLGIDLRTVDVRMSVAAVPVANGSSRERIHLRDLPTPVPYAAALASIKPVHSVRVCRPARLDRT